MSKKKRTFSAEFKTKVVLELLSGDKTQAQIASKYEINPISTHLQSIIMCRNDSEAVQSKLSHFDVCKRFCVHR